MSPVISGIIGSILASIVCGFWLKKYPLKASKKQKKYLKKRYSRNIKLANVLTIGPLILAILVFQFEFVENNDWRYGMLMIGAAFGLPLIALFLPPKNGVSNFNEALLALAIKQKSPASLLLFLMLFGCTISLVGLFNVLA